jgi:hypothetical protein
VLRPLIGLKARGQVTKPSVSSGWIEDIRARPDVA